MKIILSTVLALFLLGCSEDKAIEAEKKVVAQKDVVVQKAQVAVEKSKEVIKDTVDTVKEKTQELVEETTDAASEKIDAATEKIDEAVDAAKEISHDVTQAVQEKSDEVVEKVETKIEETKKSIAKAVEPAKAEASIDGAALYKTCIACHGVNGEKKALNKSQIIQGWDSAKIETALNGYKDGTYGSAMKGVMKPQVMKFNDAEIKAISKYISTL